jgi:L-ascorbate metabolism protein UlaG (beta-lactamase superfamily)
MKRPVFAALVWTVSVGCAGADAPAAQHPAELATSIKGSYTDDIVTGEIPMLRRGRRGPLTIEWRGQSSFLITLRNGTRIMTDPIAGDSYKGFAPAAEQADILTISHEHNDHNHRELATGTLRELHGLRALVPNPQQQHQGDFAWQRIDVRIGGVRIRTVGATHGRYHGVKLPGAFSPGDYLGLNSIFVFESQGLRIVHLGDLGEPLSDEQIRAIGRVDILLVPIGDSFTIGPDDAHEVIAQLRPRSLVLPMHYRTEKIAFQVLKSVDEFTDDEPNVRRVGNTAVTFARLPRTPEILVLSHE